MDEKISLNFETRLSHEALEELVSKDPHVQNVANIGDILREESELYIKLGAVCAKKACYYDGVKTSYQREARQRIVKAVAKEFAKLNAATEHILSTPAPSESQVKL